MGFCRATAFALVALVSSSVAQYGRPSSGGRGGSSSGGNCFCVDQYKPYCGIDGTRETTYSNLCQLNCAQKSSPGLRVKFEGVCAEKYANDREGKNFGGSATYRTTRRPYQQPTTQRWNTYPVTTQRYNTYPVTTQRYGTYPVTTRRYNQYPVTTQRYNQYPVTTQRYNQYPVTTQRYNPYPQQTTRRPYLAVDPPRDYYVQQPFQALPKTIPTTTRPWWQSQSQQSQQNYQRGNSGYGNGRQSRDADVSDEEYDDGDYNSSEEK